MKQMTMIEVVRELQKQGHDVEYYVRKDGGILVRKIDGQKYPTGASGNTIARQMVGAEISSARVTQLKFAMRQRGKRQVKIDAPDPLKEYFKQVKKKWNKAFKAKGGKPHPAGYLPWNKIKRILKEEGEEAAFARLAEAEKYASGIAYYENVRILAAFIEDAGSKYNSKELLNLAELLRENAYSIKEATIYNAYQVLYKLDKDVPPEEVAREVRKILGL